MAARVFVWYGHRLFGSAVVSLARSAGLRVIGLTGDAAAAVPAIIRARPDLVIVDRIVERDHPAALAEIVRDCQPVRVLALDLVEDRMRIYDGRGAAVAGLDEIVRAMTEGVVDSQTVA